MVGALLAGGCVCFYVVLFILDGTLGILVLYLMCCDFYYVWVCLNVLESADYFILLA